MASSAQTYSANIVGYVTQLIPNGFSVFVVPVAVTSSNNAEQVFSSLQPGDSINLWNPVTQGYNFNIYLGPNSWIDGVTSASVPAPLIPVGVGFFYNNGQGTTETNTYAGTVLLGQTNTLGNGFTLVGSAPPIGVGTVESTNISLPLQPGDSVNTWDPVTQGYHFYIYLGPSSWIDGVTSASVPAPALTVGQGFFYNNGQGSPEIWGQTNLVVQ